MTKPYCYHSLDQVRESGLIPAARMDAIVADIESRISVPRLADGRLITTAQVATFPDGTMLMYSRLAHDPDGTYIRRELMSALLTPDELELINKHASSASSAAEDAKRFEKAVKLDSWDGWVTDGDGYWDSVETYLDERSEEFGDDEGEEPAYLWVAAPQQVIPDLDVASVIEHWVDDRGWEGMDVDHLNGVKELQAALDIFVKANKQVMSYTPDTKRAVLLAGYLKAASVAP